MASASQSKKNILTFEQVTVWRNLLFDHRTLRISANELKSWPLNSYLWAAVLQAKYLHSLREPGEEHWQTPAWDFGRFAKAHPDLLNLNEGQALTSIRNSIGSKFWEEHLEMAVADAEMAFDNVWVECRAIPGYDPLTIAIIEAKRSPANLDPTLPAGYTTFLGVARSLHRQLNDAPFMLPCHKLAPLLACKPMTISRYRQKAIRDGHLKIVKEHSYRSATKGEATEFVFLQ